MIFEFTSFLPLGNFEAGDLDFAHADFWEFNGFCDVHARIINAGRFIVASRLDSPDELYRNCFTTFLRCRSISRVFGSDNCVRWFMRKFARRCKMCARFIYTFRDAPVTTFIRVTSHEHDDDTCFPSFVMTSAEEKNFNCQIRARIDNSSRFWRERIFITWILMRHVIMSKICWKSHMQISHL